MTWMTLIRDYSSAKGPTVLFNSINPNSLSNKVYLKMQNIRNSVENIQKCTKVINRMLINRMLRRYVQKLAC